MKKNKGRGAEKSFTDLSDIPTAQQLENELSRVKYRAGLLKSVVSTFSALAVAGAVAVLVSTLFVPVLRVTGTSMMPTLQSDDMLVCLRTSSLKNGDIAAFHYNNKVLIKRVIGTAGDVVDINEEGKVFVNGEELQEAYVSEFARGECDVDLPYQVPDNRVFVLGDHRAVSVDSRSTAVGCVADEYIIGRAVLRIWPPEKAGPVR